MQIKTKLESRFGKLKNPNTKHGKMLLSKTDLSFEGINLVNADLEGAKMAHMNLEGANLKGADLEGVSLRNSRLQRANLKLAILKNCNLDGANLQNTNMEGANLEGANLRNCDMSMANLQNVNFKGANLEGVSFRFSNLAGANFKGAKILLANFGGADLTDTNFYACEQSTALIPPTPQQTNREEEKGEASIKREEEKSLLSPITSIFNKKLKLLTNTPDVEPSQLDKEDDLFREDFKLNSPVSTMVVPEDDDNKILTKREIMDLIRSELLKSSNISSRSGEKSILESISPMPSTKHKEESKKEEYKTKNPFDVEEPISEERAQNYKMLQAKYGREASLKAKYGDVSDTSVSKKSKEPEFEKVKANFPL